MTQPIRLGLKRAPLLLLGLLSLGNAGCLVVAAGAAGAGAYAYHKGNVTEVYDGDFETTWRATHTALAELALPVKSQSRDNFSGTIESETGTGEHVQIRIRQEASKVPTDPVRTKVGVRVATFGDGDVSRRILAQIPGPAAFSAQTPPRVAEPAAVTPVAVPAP